MTDPKRPQLPADNNPCEEPDIVETDQSVEILLSVPFTLNGPCHQCLGISSPWTFDFGSPGSSIVRPPVSWSPVTTIPRPMAAMPR